MKTRALTIVIILLAIVSSNCLADEYIPIINKNDKVCRYIQKLYTGDIKRCGEIKYNNHAEFNWIEWSDKKIRLKNALESNWIDTVPVRITNFDINNDSKKEAIIYIESHMGDGMVYIYEVFHDDFLAKINIDLTINWSTFFKETVYSLRTDDDIPIKIHELAGNIAKLPKGDQKYIISEISRGKDLDYLIGWGHEIHFMKFDSIHYIVFDGCPSLGPIDKPEDFGHYSMIAKLKPDNTLECVCLYLIKEEH